NNTAGVGALTLQSISMIELDCNVKAPTPAVLLVAPCSWRPPVSNVPPLRVIVALLLMRLLFVTPTWLNERVPPELTVTLLVPARIEAVVLLLWRKSLPALIVVAPV